jgi:hypothetical protein
MTETSPTALTNTYARHANRAINACCQRREGGEPRRTAHLDEVPAGTEVPQHRQALLGAHHRLHATRSAV